MMHPFMPLPSNTFSDPFLFLDLHASQTTPPPPWIFLDTYCSSNPEGSGQISRGNFIPIPQQPLPTHPLTELSFSVIDTTPLPLYPLQEYNFYYFLKVVRLSAVLLFIRFSSSAVITIKIMPNYYLYQRLFLTPLLLLPM